MNFEDLGRVWRDEGGEVMRARTEALSPLRKRVREVEAKVRRRDRLEIGISLAMAPVCVALAWVAMSRSMPLAAVGMAVLAVSCSVIPWRIRKSRPSEPDVGQPVAEALAQEAAFLRSQEALLLGVPLWYVAPLVAGMLLFVLGVPSSPAFRIRGTVLILAVGALVGMINVQTARRVLRPLKLEVESWLVDLDSSPLDGDPTDTS